MSSLINRHAYLSGGPMYGTGHFGSDQLRHSHHPLTIASRRSPLARIQAEGVGEALAQLHPNINVKYVWINPGTGRYSNKASDHRKDKGQFTATVEQALLNGNADLAVHSLKDLPASPRKTKTPLVIVAVPRRGHVPDCLIGQDGPMTIERLSSGASVGTASPRRAAQLLRLRPDLNVSTIRGNVETRLNKVVHHGQYDATLLAMAGLARLGLDEYTMEPLALDLMLPAAGQGALALQCRSNDHNTIRQCLPLNDAQSAALVHGERQVVAAMHGDCHSPIAVLLESIGDQLRLRVRVLSPDGRQCIENDESGPVEQLRYLLIRTTETLAAAGAEQVIRRSQDR